MHGDVGRTKPGGAGHETPTPAEVPVSYSNAGHGEANANAARGGHHGTGGRARRKARPQSTRKAARSPPSWDQRIRIGHQPDRRGHLNERTRRIRHQNEGRKREETRGAARKPCPPPARAGAETGADRELERTNGTEIARVTRE